MDDSAFRKLGEQIRRSARGPVFEFVDESLRRLTKRGTVLPTTSLDAPMPKVKPPKPSECPECEARRKARTEAQRRWRANKDAERERTR